MEVDKQMRVAAVEDDRYFGDYAEEAFRLFLDKRRRETIPGACEVLHQSMYVVLQ